MQADLLNWGSKNPTAYGCAALPGLIRNHATPGKSSPGGYDRGGVGKAVFRDLQNIGWNVPVAKSLCLCRKLV
jgi:hypothetical protein